MSELGGREGPAGTRARGDEGTAAAAAGPQPRGRSLPRSTRCCSCRIDIATDNANCGACGKVCGSEQACSGDARSRPRPLPLRHREG
jgi:hypothetical protein